MIQNAEVSSGRLPHRRYRRAGVVSVALLTVCVQGCAAIEPWEHQYHADPIMQLVDDGEELAYQQHMFRALTQGLTDAPVGGGGCGCEQ